MQSLWFITVGEPLPTDVPSPKLLRTGLMTEDLAARGIDVVWWTSDFDHNRKQRRQLTSEIRLGDGRRLLALTGPPYAKNISLKRMWHQHVLGRQLRGRMRRETAKPDAIIVSFPTIELAYEATQFGRRHGIPVILDVRDPWPDLFLSFMPRAMRPAARIALEPQFRMTRRAFRVATAVWGVSEEYRDFGLSYAGRSAGPADAVIPIPVKPLRAEPGPATDAARDRLAAAGVDASKCVVWFAGSFGQTYDLSTVIRAARVLAGSDVGDAVQFVFSGDGEQNARWRAEADEVSNVVFTGWLSAAEMAVMGTSAAIGLQAYAIGAKQGLANKLSDYLSFGLPILGSLSGENAEFLRKWDCGVSYTAGSAESLLEELRPLVTDGALRRRLADNARAAFAENFDIHLICDRALASIAAATQLRQAPSATARESA